MFFTHLTHKTLIKTFLKNCFEIKMKNISKYFAFLSVISANILFIYGFDLDFQALSEYINEEKSLLDSLDRYLSTEEQRISQLRQIYTKFCQQNTIALKDKDLFLSHPNDVYLLIKRMTKEWKSVEELLEPNQQILNEYLLEKFKINATRFNFTGLIEKKSA